mgnify:CR=1
PYHLATPQSSGNVAAKIRAINPEEWLAYKYVSHDAPPEFSCRILSEWPVIFRVASCLETGADRPEPLARN